MDAPGLTAKDLLTGHRESEKKASSKEVTYTIGDTVFYKHDTNGNTEIAGNIQYIGAGLPPRDQHKYGVARFDKKGQMGRQLDVEHIKLGDYDELGYPQKHWIKREKSGKIVEVHVVESWTTPLYSTLFYEQHKRRPFIADQKSGIILKIQPKDGRWARMLTTMQLSSLKEAVGRDDMVQYQKKSKPIFSHAKM